LKLHEISSLNQPQLTINENIVIIPNQPSQLIPVIFEEDTNSSQSVSSVSNNASGVFKEKKTRKRITWIYYKSFECHLDYEIEDNWSYHKSEPTKDAVKEFYKCIVDKNKLSPVGISILFLNDSNGIVVCLNDQEHEHVDIRGPNDWGIDNLVKLRIKELYNAGVRKPKTILYSLR
jgi:hypothetical protein